MTEYYIQGAEMTVDEPVEYQRTFKEMKIIVRDIKSQGLELTENLDAVTIGLSEEDVKCLSPLKIKATVERVNNTILARTEVRGTYSFYCSRCLQPVQDDRCQVFDFDYPIENGLESIDLGEDIRQEMLLAFPTKILCKHDCRGICSGCGVDLNKEACVCTKAKKNSGGKDSAGGIMI